jgi:hypothetical protein
MDNQTVIDTIVKYSKDCIVKRFIKEHLKKSWMLAKLQNLPSANTIKIVIDELDFRLDEKESDIGRLFEPLFEGKDFGHTISKKHSLTISEMRDGYIMLDGEKYIILLRPLWSLDSDMKYYPGILYEVDSINQRALQSMRSQSETVLTDDLLKLIIKKKTAYEYIE